MTTQPRHDGCARREIKESRDSPATRTKEGAVTNAMVVVKLLQLPDLFFPLAIISCIFQRTESGLSTSSAQLGIEQSDRVMHLSKIIRLHKTLQNSILWICTSTSRVQGLLCKKGFPIKNQNLHVLTLRTYYRATTNPVMIESLAVSRKMKT
jgi:hypothetical protein